MFRVIATIIGVVGGTYVISEMFGNKSQQEPHIGGIKKQNIHSERLVRYLVKDNQSVIKQQVTRRLNEIIADCNYFKIGKTANPEQRATDHADFEAMYLLCLSSQDIYIEGLEAHYVNEYIDHPKNLNEKKGSPGKMNPQSTKFYLYVVVK